MIYSLDTSRSKVQETGSGIIVRKRVVSDGVFCVPAWRAPRRRAGATRCKPFVNPEGQWRLDSTIQTEEQEIQAQ